MTGPAVGARNLLVVERDDARAGRLIVALRALGANAVRWSDDERGHSQARALNPDAVLVDAVLADAWAAPALRAIESDAALGAPAVIRTDATRVWRGNEPVAEVLTEIVASVSARHDRETRALRAVAAPTPIAVPVVDLPNARQVVSSRATEKMGSVDAAGATIPIPVLPDMPQDAEPPEVMPVVEAPRARAVARFPKEKKREGFVFAAEGSDVEAESSAKVTSIDLTVVPSALLERANLPRRSPPPDVDPPRWPWILLAAVLSVIGITLAYLSHGH